VERKKNKNSQDNVEEKEQSEDWQFSPSVCIIKSYHNQDRLPWETKQKINKQVTK
jgi:hypothetical protein